MKPRSAKAKGKRLQEKIAEMIRITFGLADMDVLSVPNSVNGMDIWLSETAKEYFPFAIESKNTQSLSIWKALEQAENNKEDLEPLLIFSRNHSKIYATLEFSKLLKMLEYISTVRKIK